MRKPCSHGVSLLRGIKCVRDCLLVTIYKDGKAINRGCGHHTKANLRLAEMVLNDLKLNKALNRLDLPQKLKRIRLSEAWGVFFSHHYINWKDPDDNSSRTQSSINTVVGAFSTLKECFMDDPFIDDISTFDVRTKVKEGLITKGMSKATANRYKGLLSSMFSVLKRLCKDGTLVEAFKLPADNPCDDVPDFEEQRRERILTPYEAKKLKNAFLSINDEAGWEICEMALKTLLSLKDLKGLKVGQVINIDRAKTGVGVQLPITVLTKLDWKNFRKRWEAARLAAGLYSENDEETLHFHDLRKTGINWLNGRHDTKLISQYAGHASKDTTEKSYIVRENHKMTPLFKDLEQMVDAI